MLCELQNVVRYEFLQFIGQNQRFLTITREYNNNNKNIYGRLISYKREYTVTYYRLTFS